MGVCQMLRRVLRICFWFLVAVTTLVITLWGVMALWHRLPFDGVPRNAFCALFGLACLVTLPALVSQRRVQVITPFALCFAILFGWWMTSSQALPLANLRFSVSSSQ